MMARRIKQSLAYYGRTQRWLAEALGMTEKTLRSRMKNEGTFTLTELRVMKEIFKWETLEG